MRLKENYILNKKKKKVKRKLLLHFRWFKKYYMAEHGFHMGQHFGGSKNTPTLYLNRDKI